MADTAATALDAPPPSTRLRRLDATGVLTLIARLIVGIDFVWLGAVKILDPVPFLKAIHGYHLLPVDPPIILNATAVILPWIEVSIGVLLLCGLVRRPAALLGIFLLVVFTAAVTNLALDYQALHPEIAFTAIELDCGCGSGVVNVASKLAGNAGLILLCAWLACSRSDRFVLRRFG